MKAECNKNGRLNFKVFAWCRPCSKSANPSHPSWKDPKSVYPFKRMSKSANPFQYLARPCPEVRPLCEPSPEVRTLCESTPKVQTLSKFRRARAQKCEPFASLRQKREPFQGFGEHVPKSANPLQIFTKSANLFESLLECAKLCQNLEPFQWNLHPKCSCSRPTKTSHFYNKLMKTECDKNGRPIF